MNYNVAVIGGGIIGLSTATYLTKRDIKTVLIEKKYLGSGSTGRCIAGMRHQFSTPASIRLMKESISLFGEMKKEFGHSVEFTKSGYLLLAHSEKMAETFKKNVAIQKKEGIDVSIVTPQEIKKIVPHLNIEEVVLGTWCQDDGQAFPFAVMKGYRKQFIENKGTIITHNPVIKILKENNKFTLILKSNEKIIADKIILSAGPWTGELAKQLDMNLPLYPERHEAVISERMPKFKCPMIVDYRKDGCYFQQMENGQIIGCYTPNPNVPGIRKDASMEFLPNVSWRMARLVPALKNISFLRHWAGCYTITPDGNPIVDESSIKGCYIASGMCGHGFMFAPAIAKHLATFIDTGKWEADLGEFAFNRNFNSKTESLK